MTLASLLDVSELEAEEKFFKGSCPVALLIGQKTASAAEFVTLAFKGLDDVRVFGSETTGYTSNNRTYPMYDGALLQLTISPVLDRAGDRYENMPIQPDEKTEQAYACARVWLKEKIAEH